MYMKCEMVKKFLIFVMIVVIVLALLNTLLFALGISLAESLWTFVDVLYVLIAFLYTFFYRNTSKRGVLIAILLWIPALLALYYFYLWGTTSYAEAQGMFVLIWDTLNLYTVLIYGYLLGTKELLRD